LIDEEHRVLGSFYKDGLDRGEKAAHIVDPENGEEHLKRLADAGIPAQKIMNTGQLDVLPWTDAYVLDHRFDQDVRLATVEKQMQSGAAAGYLLTRLVGHHIDAASMKDVAMAIGRIVSENLDHWRLMYIDVVEFRHKHFMHSFREIAAGLRTYAEALAQSRKLKFPQGVDSALAVTTIYLHFFTYFLVENLFGAKRHLGMSDEQAVEQMIRLYMTGLRGGGQKA
jgi:hypothetical protein